MKRDEMLELISNLPLNQDTGFCLSLHEADVLLTQLENIGMKPPSLAEDKCQALTRVYYAGHTYNQWDEDFEKDEKAMAAYKEQLEMASPIGQALKQINKERRQYCLRSLTLNEYKGIMDDIKEGKES